MTEHIVYLALGSNLGDKLENLRSARAALPPKVNVQACSSVYETPPWGFTDQPTFYNQVVRCSTTLEPQPLLHFVKAIEQSLGREPNFRNGPRKIDIDILFYDDLILDTPELGLPHPRIEGRAFVWIPLAELAPELLHPVSRKTALEISKTLDAQQIYRVAEKECI